MFSDKNNRSESDYLSAIADKAACIQEQSSLVSRNVTIGGHRTSVRLEPEMWRGLREICTREHLSVHDIATVVSVRKAANTSLTAALRVFVMAYFRMAATEDGHNTAGHGPGGAFMSALLSRKMNEQDNQKAPFSDYFFVRKNLK